MENPYQPPQARVADAAELARGPRPPAVRRALIAFWIGWVLSFLTLIPGVREGFWDDPEVPVAVPLVMAMLLGTFSAWIIVMVGRGRNWARWTLVVYIALTYVLVALDPAGWEKQGPLALGVDAVTLVLDLYGCYLILTGESARWFTRS